jgi:hypothetical protein
MTQRLGVALVLMLTGCGGSTLRVAQDDTGNGAPVSLAPAPDSEPDSAVNPGRDSGANASGDSAAVVPPSTPSQTEASGSARPDSSVAQGYAPLAQGTELEVRRIGEWTNTGISESRRLVIRDANAWAGFWAELGVGERPAVDFTKDLVLAVAAGQRSTGGYEIEIERVTQTGGALAVEVQETSPGPNCVTTSALTQPVDVVLVPAAGVQSWSFTERKEVQGCR